MTNQSRHCVDAAINYANDPRHEGHGYTLSVKLKDGEIVEGAVTTFENQHPDVLFLLLNTGHSCQEEVFFDKNDIVKATIVW